MTQKEKPKSTNEKDVSMGNLFGGKIGFRDVDEVLVRKVSKLGNSGHISVPVKHVGKEAQVVIWKQENLEQEFTQNGSIMFKKKEEDKPKK